MGDGLTPEWTSVALRGASMFGRNQISNISTWIPMAASLWRSRSWKDCRNVSADSVFKTLEKSCYSASRKKQNKQTALHWFWDKWGQCFDSKLKLVPDRDLKRFKDGMCESARSVLIPVKSTFAESWRSVICGAKVLFKKKENNLEFRLKYAADSPGLLVLFAHVKWVIFDILW